jgi:hypothetical protein
VLVPVKFGFFFTFGLSLCLAPMLTENIFAQLEQPSDNYDAAKSSSDEALSLIDSLKGAGLLNSVVEDMQNISYPTLNQTLNNQSGSAESIDNTLSFLLPSNNTFNNTSELSSIINSTSLNQNQTTTSNSNSSSGSRFGNTINSGINDSGNTITSSNTNFQNMQSIIVTPYPMTISSGDYVPLYSSMPLKIESGNILAKLPCNSTSPLVQIVGTSADNNIFPINLNQMANFSKTGSMCMYQSIIPDDLSNLLYSHTLTNIYLYNPLDFPIDVPTTTSIFIGIHKLST